MSQYILITCDQCNPEALIPRVHASDGWSGWLFATEQEAKSMGWEDRDYGIICNRCAEVEAEEERRAIEEEATSFVGADALAGNLVESGILPVKKNK